ncbi:MAG: 23S rRNA (uracil(1939)-C(5))-methyltransferase RlmD [Erysipelotrichaceae bacterium]|nr:23S rRNA (uracil(1939)-C(5))-methyltransferase RlmD [Erysipelotrichaceae bacterium]
MQKNETYQVIAEGYTAEGEAVVKIDGIVIFVPGLIIGEEAEISITAMKKHYGYGRVIKITKPSEHRTEPRCSAARLCGGCSLQFMDDEAQKFFKEDKLRSCFRQNANMEIQNLPIIRMDPVWHYRNKVQIPVQVKKGEVQMGFYRNHSNDVVPYETCMVQTQLSNDLTKFFTQALKKYRCAGLFRHILIKHAHHTGEAMVVMIVRQYPFEGADELQAEMLQKFPAVKSLEAIVNRREDNVILDGKEILLAGRPYIEEELLECTFRISARSFYQINPYATERLYSTALEYAQLTDSDILIDLYCGTGTMGILGAKRAKKVYGIEIVADAIKDAKINAEANDVHNIQFVNADAGKGAQMIIASKIRADAMIVDPPRKGCSKDTLDAIMKIAPKRLVYVSCDPATLARDVKILTDHEYQLEKIQPVDMFPQTVHVETVVLMSRVEG